MTYHVSSRFRWVVCQLETLRRSVQRNLRGVLEKLPKTLDETYERVLKDINEDNRGHARRLLHCLAVAIRPLRVEELAEILAFDFNDVQEGAPKFHAGWRWKDHEEAVLSTCSSLITVVNNRGSRVVQFSHFSVKEFLTSDRLASSTGDVARYHILPGPAHTILAQACLGFLLHLDDHIDKKSIKGFPLAKYAARHWVAHAKFEDVASRVKDGMRSLFDPDKRHLMAWLGIYNIDTHSSGVSPSDIPNPLYYSALCGFHDLVEHLVVNNPHLVNVIGGEYDSPLLAALSRKHSRVAEFLLRRGGKVDVRGTNEQTPLHMAIEFTEEVAVDVVRFLLEHGADVNSQRDDLCTPLHVAASYGAIDVAQVLLDRGADIDSRDDKGKTSLNLFLESGAQSGEDIDPRFARLLLEHGANVNARDEDHSTPLLLAMERKSYASARILLEHSAEPNVKNNDGKTPLHLLSEGGGDFSIEDNALDLARLLLGRGANVNAQDNDHTTPLLLAVKQGLCKIARILLEHGADPSATKTDGKTPLYLVLKYKSHFKDEEILISSPARSLLEHGADVNAQDKDHITPLLLAMQRNMYEIVRILLGRGAKPDVKNDKGKTPLHLLLEGDFTYEDDIPGLARLLLDRGADVNAQDNNHVTPLLLAAERNLDDIARILLERGAEPNVKNNKGKTPLHILLDRNFHDYDDVDDVLVVERLLLECGADVNAQDEDNTTPLQLASDHRRLAIAQVILDSANAKKDRRQTPTLEGEFNSYKRSQRYTVFPRTRRRLERAEQGPTSRPTLDMLLWGARDGKGAARPWCECKRGEHPGRDAIAPSVTWSV
jgi:ankyrin repeat protein